LQKKTTILLINKKGKENKIIQIPSGIILHWRKYLLLINCLIILLLGIIGIYIYQKTSEHYIDKLARANIIKNQIDLVKVKQSLNSIDENIHKINKSLNARGLESIPFENAGGIGDNIEITDINNITEFYANKIKEIKNTLIVTPLGKPTHGNISSLFGNRMNPFGGLRSEKHVGIDFKGKIGDPVKSTAKGIVIFTGVKGSYGKCIIIKHNNYLQTLYAHLSNSKVKVNQKIKAGEIIGTVGNSGRSTGPHLHYEVIHNDKKIDPKLFLKL